MDAATLYILLVCVGSLPYSCDLPLGAVPSLTREVCVDHLMAIRRAGTRVLCVAPSRDGFRPQDIVDSEGVILRPVTASMPARHTATLFAVWRDDHRHTVLDSHQSVAECEREAQMRVEVAVKEQVVTPFCIEGFEDQKWSE
jgi:hypothetical protein